MSASFTRKSLFFYGGVVALALLLLSCSKPKTGAAPTSAAPASAAPAAAAQAPSAAVSATAVVGAAVQSDATAPASAAPASAAPAAQYLPPGYADWRDFDKKQAAFRAERVAAQEALPVNADGSRVWLGQVVFADPALDAQIKTFGMARQLVKAAPVCDFMTMDGTRVKFSEAGMAEAVGKLAAKKYVKVFGWLDEQAGTLKLRYLDVAGEKFVWKDGTLVKE